MEHRVTNFFDAGSPWLQHPLLTAERTGQELDEIEKYVPALSDRSLRVLDIGCGFGRHGIELAVRGHRVTACDPSEAMLVEARSRAVDAGVDVDFRQQRGQDFDVVDEFDLALCLFTTLGQRATTSTADATDAAGQDDVMVERIARALVPSGCAVFEVPHAERTVDALVADEMLGPTHVTRGFDAQTSTVSERFELGDGTIFDLAYRVFSPDDLLAVITQAGLRVVATADHGLATPPVTFMTVVAQRPE